VEIEILGDLSVDLFNEVQKFGGPMPLVAFADDKAGGDVERCEQRGRAMTDIGVSLTFRLTRHHRQDRLFAIERLNLALFIDAQDQRPIGQGQVEPNDVADLVDEQRITRKLEGLRAMRLQPEGSSDPARIVVCENPVAPAMERIDQ
jgi:hypothetical protein